MIEDYTFDQCSKLRFLNIGGNPLERISEKLLACCPRLAENLNAFLFSGIDEVYTKYLDLGRGGYIIVHCAGATLVSYRKGLKRLFKVPTLPGANLEETIAYLTDIPENETEQQEKRKTILLQKLSLFVVEVMATEVTEKEDIEYFEKLIKPLRAIVHDFRRRQIWSKERYEEYCDEMGDFLEGLPSTLNESSTDFKQALENLLEEVSESPYEELTGDELGNIKMKMVAAEQSIGLLYQALDKALNALTE